MRFRRSRQPEPAWDRVQAIETRLAHLESMIEGLQDAVHRESIRTNSRLDDVEHRLDPSELSRELSRDQRERGL
jgi:uncharacterized coiled-coil protein SlyX